MRRHENEFAGGAVEHDAEIELAVNGRGLFNQQALHLLPLRAGLVRHQLHAQNVLRVQFGVFAGPGHLHAAALAAASSVNLCLDHHTACTLSKQLAGHCRGLFQRVCHFAFGHGNAVLGQNLFCLILVNFHDGGNRPFRRGCLRSIVPGGARISAAASAVHKYYPAGQTTGNRPGSLFA